MICQCCQSTMKALKRFCSGEHHEWHACPHNLCRHRSLNIDEKTNRRFQAGYRSKRPMKSDIKDGKLDVVRYSTNRQDIRDRRVAMIAPHLPKTGTMLDVGCGGGYMLAYYRDRFEGIGVEIAPLCRGACKEQDIPCVTSLEETSGQYSVVMAWHVIEHIVHMREFLQAIAARVDAGGLLILEVPVKRRLAENYNGHAHEFLDSSFERLLFEGLTGVLDFNHLLWVEGVQAPARLWIGQRIA